MSGEKNLDHAESVQDVEVAPQVCFLALLLFTSQSSNGIMATQVTGESYNGTDLSTREKALVWKQDLRIVPLCAGIYLLCYLDRSNIGNWQPRTCSVVY